MATIGAFAALAYGCRHPVETKTGSSRSAGAQSRPLQKLDGPSRSHNSHDAERKCDAGCAYDSVTDRCACILARQQDTPWPIMVSNDYVFWGTRTAVLRVSKFGDDQEVLATNQRRPMGMAIFDAEIYWTNIGDGTVMGMTSDGKALRVLASGQGLPIAVAVDSESVYWTVMLNPESDIPEGKVVKAPKGGGSVTVLADKQPIGMSTGALSINGSNLYLATARGIARISVQGGSPVIFQRESADWVLVRGGELLLETIPEACFRLCPPGAGSSIIRMPLQGGLVTTIVTLTSSASGIGVDKDSIYWIQDGTISAVPRKGGSVERLHSGGDVARMAVDEDGVFWTSSEGTIVRLAPKNIQR